MIHHGDCLEVMAGMEPESVDAIVTDPPYDLTDIGRTLQMAGNRRHSKGFMGKSWDGTRIAFEKATWEAAYRVAKPSSYLLAFGGTRTVHRMTCAIEDAGWIVRDMLVWGYASGFPKSKASLKPAWEPIVMARKPGPLRMLAIDECRIPAEDGTETGRGRYPVADDAPAGMGKGLAMGGNGSDLGRWPANVILTDPIFDGGIEGVVGGGDTGPAGTAVRRNIGISGRSLFEMADPDNRDDMTYGDTGTYSRFFLIPKSSRSDREPVTSDEAYVLHRERGECDKLGAWDSEDQSRSEPTVSTSPGRATSGVIPPATPTGSSSGTSSPGSPQTDPSPRGIKSTIGTATSRTTGSITLPSLIPSPTNASTPDASSGMALGGSPAPSAESSSLWEAPTGISVVRAGRSTDDADRATSGSSSSRSVCARCGKRLPRVSTHPTVKPTELMRHLVRLVTPTGGTVLDPFLGSGTTALAAEMEGFGWIGIEREAEYVAIVEARLNGTQRGLGLEAS